MQFAGKATASLLTFFFLGGIFLCVGMVSSMQHDMSMGTSCSTTSVEGGCSAPIDHLSYWSNILSVIPSDFAALILALAACACVWIVCRGIWNPLKHLCSPHYSLPPPRTFFLPRHALQEAFSNGILHSKRY